jgi:hypothetical protein
MRVMLTMTGGSDDADDTDANNCYGDDYNDKARGR